MKKTVIFVGGSAYSGSTMLDMMLSNNLNGFSCGEVNALFWPKNKYHVNPPCGCGDEKCEIWTEIRRLGEDRLYENIFKNHPAVDYIVDSSKDPIWIRERSRDVARQGYRIQNVLLWKTPAEYYQSRKKRGLEKGWQKSWRNYYRLYMTTVDRWVTVKYSDLVRDRNYLQKLCESLDIPFHDKMDEYWNKKHHTLFGNTRAKVHLYDRNSGSYKKTAIKLDSELKNEPYTAQSHKKIYYEVPSGSQLSNNTSAAVSLLESELQNWSHGLSVCEARTVRGDILMPKAYIVYYSIKGKLLTLGFLLKKTISEVVG